jgi:putative transposase
MQLMNETTNYSNIIQSVKWNFTFEYKKMHHIDGSIQLWQPRFWDHIIRDESDLEKHMDYIHYNPVKHGVAKAPSEWKHSTYQFWQDRGIYPRGWGIEDEPESISGLMME